MQNASKMQHKRVFTSLLYSSYYFFCSLWLWWNVL